VAMSDDKEALEVCTLAQGDGVNLAFYWTSETNHWFSRRAVFDLRNFFTTSAIDCWHLQYYRNMRGGSFLI